MSEKTELNRRRFVGAAAASLAAGQLGLIDFFGRSEAMTDARADVPTGTGGGSAGLRPFRVNIPDEELADLRRRVKAARWPERETVNDFSQGVRLGTMQKL